MTEMSKAEVARFLMQDTFTGKLATVKKDGSRVKKNAKTYGEVNSGEGAILVRIKPTKVIAEKDISILG